MLEVKNLLYDLAYTRHPAAIRCVREYLHSDEEIGGGGAAMRHEEINRFVSAPLRRILKNYPRKTPDMSGEEYLRVAREWMGSHTGDWEFYESTSEWPEEWLER